MNDTIDIAPNETVRPVAPQEKISVLARIRSLLMDPDAAWDAVAKEEGGLLELFLPYGILMATLPAIGATLGTLLMGLGISLIAGLFSGLASLGVGLFYLFAGTLTLLIGTMTLNLIVAKGMELLAPRFGAKADWTASCRVLVYSATAPAVAGVIAFVPLIGQLALLAALVFGVYSFYLGLGKVLGAQGEKRVFFLVTIGLLYFIGTLALTGFTAGLSRNAFHRAAPIHGFAR